MENDFIRCSNGHYYRKSLNVCPYCGSALERGNTCLPNELKCSSKDYIVIKGHYYRLNSDGKTASFLCWSKVAWDIYRKYLSFHDWYIEATLDDVNEIAKEEAYYAKERIQSRFPSYEIPKEITLRGNVYPVVRIDNGAFAFCEISSILIPDTIVYIEKDAFFRCDGLKNLVIPNSVKELSNRAISECEDLKTITWQGITYEDDLDEPFLFPDNKNKYVISLPTRLSPTNSQEAEFKHCSNGHYYNHSLTECPYCKMQEPPSRIERGDPIRTALFCPICGEKLDNIEAQCPNCGVTWDWRYNDNIDLECAHLYPNDCNIDRLWNDAASRYRRWLVDFKIEAPTPSDPLQIEWFIMLHNDIVQSEWYRAMHAYIDAYTRKIIERHHCYKYGLAHLDEQTQKLSSFEGDDYLNIFCELKSAIIRQDYGLLWYTPQVLKRELCPHCDTVLNSDKDTCPRCGLSRKWKYNDNIDPECKEWFPEFCTLGGPYHEPTPSEIAEELHRHREHASGSGIDNSEWYALMQMYIDEYTFKIIERKQCYKYGLPELDDNKENVKLNHIFWKLKKAIIKQDYGLNWLTPEEHFEGVRTGYFLRT